MRRSFELSVMTVGVKVICRFGVFDEGLENRGFFVVLWRIPFLSPPLLLLGLTMLPFEVIGIGTDHIDMGIQQGIASAVAPPFARPNLLPLVGDDEP